MKIDDQRFEVAYSRFVDYVTGKEKGDRFATFNESCYLRKPV